MLRIVEKRIGTRCFVNRRIRYKQHATLFQYFSWLLRIGIGKAVQLGPQVFFDTRWKLIRTDKRQIANADYAIQLGKNVFRPPEQNTEQNTHWSKTHT